MAFIAGYLKSHQLEAIISTWYNAAMHYRS